MDTLKLLPEVYRYAQNRPPYAPQFRRQMIDLVRAGRDPDDLADEFEPTAHSIRNGLPKLITAKPAGKTDLAACPMRNAKNSSSCAARSANSAWSATYSQSRGLVFLG